MQRRSGRTVETEAGAAAGGCRCRLLEREALRSLFGAHAAPSVAHGHLQAGLPCCRTLQAGLHAHGRAAPELTCVGHLP